MNAVFKTRLARDLQSPLSVTRLMFSRSGLISKLAQLGVGTLSRALVVLGADTLGNTIRTKRLNAVHRYRITCDALLNDAAESGLFDTYVDLGAHHGEQVLQMGKRLSVLAFEPDPRAFEWLTKSVIANRESLRDDIQLLPLGVSNSSGVAKLNFSEASPSKQVDQQSRSRRADMAMEKVSKLRLSTFLMS